MANAPQIDGTEILHAFDEWTARWHQSPFAQTLADDFDAAIEGLHRANFELWHQEDKARDVHAGDTAIAAAKRAIDVINQRRNDQIEHCDELLLKELSAENLPNFQAELHSETPGMMLDRLSIMSLKMYHTGEEMERTPSPPRSSRAQSATPGDTRDPAPQFSELPGSPVAARVTRRITLSGLSSVENV